MPFFYGHHSLLHLRPFTRDHFSSPLSTSFEVGGKHPSFLFENAFISPFLKESFPRFIIQVVSFLFSELLRYYSTHFGFHCCHWDVNSKPNSYSFICKLSFLFEAFKTFFLFLFSTFATTTANSQDSPNDPLFLVIRGVLSHNKSGLALCGHQNTVKVPTYNSESRS